MNTAVAVESWKGQIVDGKFPLLEWLGASQGTNVFLTELPDAPGQKAAIKIIRSSIETEGAVLARWQAIAELSHPHLMGLLHFGRWQNDGVLLLYSVADYADEALSQIIPSRVLTTAETGEMVRGVADVLMFLRDKGFVHGHIKPSNIMAVGDQLKISSDCIQAVGGARGQTGELSAFDAPEALTSPVSTAGDVWSLGMTVVAALTQNTPDWDRRNARDPSILKSIAGPFRQIARECLRVDPARRCSLEQVKGWLEGKDVPAAPVERPAVPASEPKSSKTPVAAIAVFVIVVAAIVAVLNVTQHKAPPRVAGVNSEMGAPTPTAAVPNARDNVQKPNAPGAVLDRGMPNVSRGALNTIHGKIKVKVTVEVDSTGKVQNARLDRSGPSKYFANAALTASRQWKFKPAQNNGQPVSSKWSLRYSFSRGGTDVNPEQISP